MEAEERGTFSNGSCRLMGLPPGGRISAFAKRCDGYLDTAQSSRMVDGVPAHISDRPLIKTTRKRNSFPRYAWLEQAFCFSLVYPFSSMLYSQTHFRDDASPDHSPNVSL